MLTPDPDGSCFVPVLPSASCCSIYPDPVYLAAIARYTDCHRITCRHDNALLQCTEIANLSLSGNTEPAKPNQRHARYV